MKYATQKALDAFKKIRACTVNVWDVDEEIKALEEALAKQEQFDLNEDLKAWQKDGSPIPAQQEQGEPLAIIRKALEQGAMLAVYHRRANPAAYQEQLDNLALQLSAEMPAYPAKQEQCEPPSDENIFDAWVSASESDGIGYDGPSFDRGYRLGRGEYDEYTGALVSDAIKQTQSTSQEPVGTATVYEHQADDKGDVLGDRWKAAHVKFKDGFLDEFAQGTSILLYTTPQPKQEQGEPVGEIVSWPDDLTRLGVKWIDSCPPEGAKIYTTPQQRKPLTDEQFVEGAKAVDEIMEQAQVFASAWSLVGGRFDGGNAMDDAEIAKSELRVMVASLANAAAHGIKE